MSAANGGPTPDATDPGPEQKDQATVETKAEPEPEVPSAKAEAASIVEGGASNGGKGENEGSPCPNAPWRGNGKEWLYSWLPKPPPPPLTVPAGSSPSEGPPPPDEQAYWDQIYFCWCLMNQCII